MKAKRRQRKLRQSEVQQENVPFFHSGQQSSQQSFFGQNIQTKLTIGKPGDKYEQQADQVASKVVKGEGIQRQEEMKVRKQEEEEAQAKLQRQEEEEAQAKLQMQEEEEAQTKLQRQSEAEEEEALQTKLQKQEEEEAQTKLQRQSEEEEAIQAKSVQRKEAGASKSIEAKINTQKSSGFPLPNEIREDMENKMDASFKHVRIHNDNAADKLCEELNALAFTVGNHVFFRSGKYQPHSSAGKELLAHELTHVIQQRGSL